MKTRIFIIVLPLIILSAFLYFLNDKLLFEELLLLYLFPYLLFSILFGLYALLKLLFGKKLPLNSFFNKTIITSSVFNILFLSLIIYISYPNYVDKKDAIRDIDFMIATFEKVHPDIYNQITKDRFYSDTKKLKNRLHQKVKIEEFYKDISTLAAEIKDGHTTADFSSLVNTGILFFKKIFPYKIKILDNKVFVIKNYSYKDNIEIGSEIININGIAAYKVIEDASRIVSYESNVFRNYLLENPFWLSMWNNYNDFELTYRENSTGKIKSIKASGGLYAKISFQKEIMKSYMEPFYEFKILENNIGYIGFYQFTNFSKFSNFLKEAFYQIKKKGIRELIIDIRDNIGGDSALGDELLQYISPQPFRQFEKTIMKISKEAISRKNIDEIYKDKLDSLIVSNNINEIVLRENPLRFNGNCFLLVGNHTFSSATDFASAFQCYNVGKIIGTETGGLTICYGDICHFNLPNSKIMVGVSYKKFYNACGVDNRRGIIPDYIIDNTFEDERNNFDRVLNFTINLINKKTDILSNTLNK